MDNKKYHYIESVSGEQMYNFESNEAIEEIIKKSRNTKLTLKALEFTYALIQENRLNIKEYRWQMLANHIAAMADRAETGEKLEEIEVELFKGVAKDSIEYAERIVNFIGNLGPCEKYLLSVHFESSKFI